MPYLIGDSGGPLYIVESGKQYVVGIVSYGTIGCANGFRFRFLFNFNKLNILPSKILR